MKIKTTLELLLEALFRDITALGGLVIYSFLTVLMFFINIPLAVTLIIGFFITFIATILIRSIYFKHRPKKQEYHNFIEKIDASSFPSLHAARITFLFFIFSFYLSNILATSLLFSLSLLIIYSRIYLQKHDVKDIIGGIILGALTYILTNTINPLLKPFINSFF